MAFRKFARAAIVKPDIQFDNWAAIKQVGDGTTFTARTAAKVVLQEFDPKQFLLSHVTIMASVDTEDSKAPLGKHSVDGFEVDRRFSDYIVTPNTSKYINNNYDAWTRQMLLSSYKTFIGAENYLEHVQIPELSKGKIIDAAARDLGESVYIDILVATDRKHAPLISAITEGQLQTLSMGCFVPGTPVTMADGTRVQIEDVAPGDMVLTHKGRAREVLNKQIRYGQWGMRRISVVGIPDAIEATDNHPFFVLRPSKFCACGCGEALQAKDRDPMRRMTERFKAGHDKRILDPNGIYSLDEARIRQERMQDIHAFKVEQVRADELCEGDYVIFPKLDTEKTSPRNTGKARLLGYFLAEGSFLKRKGEPTEVQFNFALSEKDTFAAEVQQLLKAEFSECNPWIQERPDCNTVVVHGTGNSLVAWFKQHGGEYSHGKRLSAEAMQWCVEDHLNLIGTWVSGDGHHHKNGHSVAGTASYALACQMHTLAVRCGLAVRLECGFGGRSATLAEAVVGGTARRHVETGELATFTLCFPQSTSNVLAGVASKAPTKNPNNLHLRSLDDKVIFPISKIEEFAYEGWVHNMEVEEDNSYQVHGLATHNCQVAYTTCTRCGNVAVDETQLCRHIMYEKGKEFKDEKGRTAITAELCGHHTEPDSVKFIEASWVANPAFKGAVMRNILNPDDVKGLGKRLQVAFTHAPRVPDAGSNLKAAKVFADDMGEFPGAEGQQSGGQSGGQSAEEPDALDKAVDSVADLIREKALSKVKKDIDKGNAPVLPSENLNNNLIKEALLNPRWRRVAYQILRQVPEVGPARRMLLGMILYRKGGWKAVQASSFRSTEILALSRLMEMGTRKASRAGHSRVYRTVLRVGGVKQYPNEKAYLAACSQVIGRRLTDSEATDLLEKGYLYSLGS